MEWLKDDILKHGKCIVYEKFNNTEIKIISFVDRVYYFKIENQKIISFVTLK